MFFYRTEVLWGRVGFCAQSHDNTKKMETFQSLKENSLRTQVYKYRHWALKSVDITHMGLFASPADLRQWSQFVV